jgi:hypothetical protein
MSSDSESDDQQEVVSMAGIMDTEQTIDDSKQQVVSFHLFISITPSKSIFLPPFSFHRTMQAMT